MDQEDLIKYLTWIVFFGLALAGLYFMLRRLGVMGGWEKLKWLRDWKVLIIKLMEGC